MQTKITEQDIKDFIDFEKRLDKHFNRDSVNDKEKFYWDIYNSYVTGKQRYCPRSVNHEDWQKMNKEERIKAVKKENYNFLKHLLDDTLILSELHNVPLKIIRIEIPENKRWYGYSGTKNKIGVDVYGNPFYYENRKINTIRSFKSVYFAIYCAELYAQCNCFGLNHEVFVIESNKGFDVYMKQLVSDR